MHLKCTFQGPTRLFGSGAGSGAFVLPVERTAMPLLKKYVGPFVKQVEQNVLKAVLPEVVSLFQGMKNIKRAIEEADDVRVGGGPSGPRKGKLNTYGASLPPKPSHRRSAAAKDQVISHKKKSKEVGLTFWRT